MKKQKREQENICLKSLRAIGVFLLSFCLGVIYPLLIIACSPIYLFRFIVSKLKWLGPKLGNIISPLSTLCAVDDIYNKPKFSILVCTHLKGYSPDILTVLRQSMFDSVINERVESGDLRNPELQQYPHKWMGFLFWKWDLSFDIANHINYYIPRDADADGKFITKDELSEIQKYLVLKPYSKNRSPWEIVIVKNVESDNGSSHCVLLFRFHHSIGDGFAIMELISSLTNHETATNPTITQTLPEENRKQNSVTKFLRFAKDIILAPYKYTNYFLESFDKNVLTECAESPKVNLLISISQKIPLGDLKYIAKAHSVSLSAVIFAGFAGAVEQMLIRKNKNVPRYMHVTCPAPLPRRPNKLTNHMSVVFAKLPIGDCDSLERLKTIHRTLNELKSPLYSYITYCQMLMLGNLFPWMIKLAQKSSGMTTGACSTFPGAKERRLIKGQEIMDTYFMLGPCLANFPVLYCTLTYCNSIKLVVTANSEILGNENEVGNIINDIQKEFHILKDDSFV